MITTKNNNNGVTLKTTSAVEYISLLGEALHTLCLDATGNESCAHEIQLAAVEALNNVVLHAYYNHPENDIVVNFFNENSCLRIEIINYGLSMTSLPVAELPSYDVENGRGWWIINACVDEYYYKTVENIERERLYKPTGSNEYFENILVKSHCNVLTLIKHF